MLLEGIIPVSRLLIYDTSNFIDFPIGGQLTSIGNFLHYLCEEHPERTDELFLVGVTTDPEEVGQVKQVERFNRKINFLPVALAQKDLSNTSKSLRLSYAKGLLACRKLLKVKKNDCNYIHSPEAYGVVKLFCPAADCVIFSHGSYFNMERGFRFFQKNILIKKGFMFYIRWILKNARMIFLLDRDSMRDYEPYNRNLVRVSNSIVCPVLEGGQHFLTDKKVRELLFVGRLSKDKRVEPIIQAVLGMEEVHLTVVGDGEEYSRLAAYEGERIHFAGAVSPGQVKRYMQEADIAVMNSVFEGVPMTILEAISFGLPVISTRVGGIGDVLHFGQDSEETDGTAGEIRAAVARIEKSYDGYSRNAYENSKAFDYRQINRTIYELLCNYWKPAD